MRTVLIRRCRRAITAATSPCCSAPSASAYNRLQLVRLRVALDWVAQLCGIPASYQGVFSSGGSTANLVALGAARQWAFERRGPGIVNDRSPT